MASPSLSATLTFVKKYPITLCGFSLFFMPSVHRLLLYFTPLLLSTAIFIVAMMTWGPRVSSEKSATYRRAGRCGAKRKLMAEHNEWAFHESMGMDDEEDDEEESVEEEEEEEEGDQTEEVDTTKLSLKGKASQTLHTRETTQKGEVEIASGLESRVELEAADLDLVEMVASGGNSTQVDEPDPDLQGGAGVGTTANDDMDLHEEPYVHDGCPHVDDVHATHKSNMPIRGDGNDGIEPHAGPDELGLETHDMTSLDAHVNMEHVHDHDADDHTPHDMVDTHAHQQHQHQPHDYDHVQEEVHTLVEQNSYILERLVQVSA